MATNAAESSEYDPTVYTFLLIVLCVLLLVFLLGQLSLSFYYRNKLCSWHTCFHLLCLLWTVVRITYWVMLATKTRMTYLQLYMLYWVPTPIQFANFSLLVLFYIQVISGSSWRKRWRSICLPLYFLMTMAMATFTAVWALNSSNDISMAYAYGDEYDLEFSKVTDVKIQLIYSAISFFLLSILFGFFGWKMAKVENWKRRRLLISKPRTLALTNFCLFVIFFTRSIRDLTTSQSWLLSIWNQLDMNGKVTSFAYFIFFCFWEFLPTVLLLLLITTKAGGVGAPRNSAYLGYGNKLPDFGIFHVINAGKENEVLVNQKEAKYGGTGSSRPINVCEYQRWTHGGDLFADPSRYDSDDGGSSAPGNIFNSLNSESSLSATSLTNSYEKNPASTSNYYPPV